MPLQATSGAASYDAFGGGVPVVPAYIEEVFSTYLYTGNNSTQTITNGLDLSTKGGLVWIKNRTTGATNHALFDTVRGAGYVLSSNTSSTSQSFPQSLTSFNTTGFSLDYDAIANDAANFVSWSFRKQPKFFTTVSYTGNSGTQNIAHDLGSVPAFIITKTTTESARNWRCYHRSLGNDTQINLNGSGGANTGQNTWNYTTPTSTVFSLGDDPTSNTSGESYIAYLFAHDAGGFGLTGTDNVISCGSYSGTGSTTGFDVTLGYEPQWVLVKRSSGGTGNWTIVDNMRGFAVTAPNKGLTPNTADAEYNLNSTYPIIQPTATGFRIQDTTNADWNASSSTYIYIAIRRGPMKVPTSGTSVFNTVLWTGNSTNNRQITGVGFNPDFVEAGTRSAATTFDRVVVDRLRGTGPYLATYATQIEQSNSDLESFDNDGITVDYVASGAFNNNSNIYGHFFKRAPSFFDVVCAAGTSTSNQRISHNLTVVPELIITKGRDRANAWPVYSGSINSIIYLNSTSAIYTNGSYFPWGTSAPTTTDFGINSGTIDLDSFNGVFYLFATCAGVSKVFSYTGNGSSKTIDCGFTGGARFVLIKRTDSTGDWYVWDTARNIVSGNDPHLSLNSTAAEVTTDDTIDTDTTGFIVNQVSATNVNVTDATYIGLAIA